MATVASVVETDALLKTVWLAFAAGVGLPVVCSLALVGFVRSGDARRDRRPAAFGVYAALAAVAGAAAAGGVVLGLLAVLRK